NSPWSFDEVYDALKADRKSHYLGDWTFSAIIMLITAGVVFAMKKNKLNSSLAYLILALLIGGDMARVSKRYLNNDEFSKEVDFSKRFAATAADQSILKDTDPHHRVINLSVSPWTDGLTCYQHENVGGHHAAKLQRYQELIENQLSPQIQKLQQGLRQQGDRIFLDPTAARSLPVYNMLNTKYFILQPNNANGYAQNPAACGNAWFVSNIQKANTAREEMDALGNFDPNSTAIVSTEFEEQIYNYNFDKSVDSKIELNVFEPNKLVYTTSNQNDGLAVFSEVYYKNGWVATIDNEEAEIVRVNYLLRGLKVPAGTHEIVMEFKPKSYPVGQGITYAGSALFVLFSVGLTFLYFRKNQESIG
ncbi:MAG: YfhO family protein, partial [Salibacteraceae bacterium]|nr:YfhO family protein [Salibacteraceae bacterium]